MGAQLALYEGCRTSRRQAPRQAVPPPLCARCRAREARYGFRDEAAPLVDRPRTLCFDCFRVEIARRRGVIQARLPLEQTLESLRMQRRRAQIAARHALDAGADRLHVSCGGPPTLDAKGGNRCAAHVVSRPLHGTLHLWRGGFSVRDHPLARNPSPR